MNTQDVIEKLQGAKPDYLENTVRFCFHVLPDDNDCFTLDADAIVIYDDLRDYLERYLEIDEDDLDELYAGEIVMINSEADELLEQCLTDHDVNWDDYKEAVELAERMGQTNARDIVAAGLYLDISLDCIEEAYLGEYNNDGEYAEKEAEQLGYLLSVPKFIRQNINWEGVAEDLSQGFMEQNGFYFRCM